MVSNQLKIKTAFICASVLLTKFIVPYRQQVFFYTRNYLNLKYLLYILAGKLSNKIIVTFLSNHTHIVFIHQIWCL